MDLDTQTRSAGMTRMCSVERLEDQRAEARNLRVAAGGEPTVHYFHQADDPYSHLAVQKLDEIQKRYAVKFEVHLVSAPTADYQGSSKHFNHWARCDAASVAADYSTDFSPSVDWPSASSVELANQALAVCLDQSDFPSFAEAIGRSLWSGEAVDWSGDVSVGKRALEAGDAKRRALGHYQGAMFYFDGEWFWGIDRIRLLERRLISEGFDTRSGASLCVPEPVPLDTKGKNLDGIVLEYFPSLRSPYTAIGHQRVLELIDLSGVTVKVMPVLPMMMRGVPAPMEKQRYIMTDAGREGREHGSPIGQIVDPFGEPVKRGLSLYAAADRLGFGMKFVSAYLQAAWVDGIDITSDDGLRQVVANAELDWERIHADSQILDWMSLAENNFKELDQEKLWGVPCFRVSGGNSSTASVWWGQDRIWRVANEIARRA